MGADGHVRIYSKAKLTEKFGEEKVTDFLDFICNSVTYVQKLEDKEYITRYWGDNLYLDGMYELIRDAYNAETDEVNEKHYVFSQWEYDEFKRLKKKTRLLYSEMVRYMESDCSLAQWEVWT